MIQLDIAGEPVQMHRLADEVLLSRGGLSRCVSGLEARGLVGRSRGAPDVRQVYTRLTPAGHSLLADATDTHLSGVRELFLDRLEDTTLAQLGSTWRELLNAPPTAITNKPGKR